MTEPAATVDYRIRFDESGPAGSARPGLYLRIAQDVAWIHSERLGFTRQWYAESGLAWLVRACALDIRAAAGHGDVVSATTRVVGYRRIWARRRTDIVGPGGPVADVLTDWILTDVDGRPVRIPAAFAERAPGDAATLAPLRAEGPPGRAPDLVAVSTVRQSELDPLEHVNNAAYLDRLGDFVAGLAPPPGEAHDRPSIVLEYLAAAGPQDRVEEAAWSAADGRAIHYRMTLVGGGPIVRATVRSAAD